MEAQKQLRLIRYDDIQILVNEPFKCQDAFRFLLGDHIAWGAYRSVYTFDFIPNTVIKVAMSGEANMMECGVWEAVKNTPHAKWFAPCLHISPSGHFLIQRKVRSITPKDKLPKQLPDFFEDIKKENFGFIGKQLVCHDYQFISRAFDCAAVTRRTVNWK